MVYENRTRLIKNTILKSSSKEELVRMIHILIKNIERKARLKGLKIDGEIGAKT